MPLGLTQLGGFAGAAGGIEDLLQSHALKIAQQQAAQLAEQKRQEDIRQFNEQQSVRKQQADTGQYGAETGRFSALSNDRLGQGRLAVDEGGLKLSQDKLGFEQQQYNDPTAVALRVAKLGSENAGIGKTQAETRNLTDLYTHQDAQAKALADAAMARQREQDAAAMARTHAGGAEDRLTAAAKPNGGQALPASIADDLITMKTVSDLIGNVKTLGKETGWKGVGGLGTGTIASTAMNVFGYGTPQEQSLRDNLGNIKATIAKLRGGTSFTPNEQRLLDTYTPNQNDNDAVIQQKLDDLDNFIALKRQNTDAQYGRTSTSTLSVIPSARPQQPQFRFDPTTGQLVPVK